MLAQVPWKEVTEFVERVGLGGAFALGLLLIFWRLGSRMQKTHEESVAAQAIENKRHSESDTRQERLLRGIVKHEKAVVALVQEVQKQTAGCPLRQMQASGATHAPSPHAANAAAG
jgi:hypothetical protein